MDKYFVCGGSDTHWKAVGAKTLVGAKAVASKFYQQDVGGKIEVAIKRGYNKWQSE